jgi:hypothetical protein
VLVFAVLTRSVLHAETSLQSADAPASCTSVCERELSCCADDSFRDAWQRGCASLDFGGCPFNALDASTVARVAESAGGECDFDSLWAQWSAIRTPCSSGRPAVDVESVLDRVVATLRVNAVRGWRGSQRSQVSASSESMRRSASGTWMVALELAVAWRVR